MKNTLLTVRGFHCDAYGHVNNARYLEFYEQSRWDFLQPALDNGFLEDYLFVLVEVNVKYKKPLVPNQEIKILVNDVSFMNKSMQVSQEIRDVSTNDVCSIALVTFVLLDKVNQKPVAISAEIKDQFLSLLH